MAAVCRGPDVITLADDTCRSRRYLPLIISLDRDLPMTFPDVAGLLAGFTGGDFPDI